MSTLSSRQLRLLGGMALISLAFFGCSGDDSATKDDPEANTPVTFAVSIENISSTDELETPIAPGVWAVHQEGAPLFELGSPASSALERLAEDGAPDLLSAALRNEYDSGIFANGTDAYDDGAILPGQTFEFSFDAQPGDHLSIAAMFVQSNDFFVGLADAGAALFDEDGEPVTGRVPAFIYNAGTEVDQPLGEGEDQAPRQSGPATGADENGVVEVSPLKASDYVLVTISIVN